MASQMIVPASRDTLFFRNFLGNRSQDDIREFFEREADSPVYIEFFKQSEIDGRLYIALRFETKDIAKDILNRYDGADVLGDRVQVSWFKDLRKAKSKGYPRYSGPWNNHHNRDHGSWNNHRGGDHLYHARDWDDDYRRDNYRGRDYDRGRDNYYGGRGRGRIRRHSDNERHRSRKYERSSSRSQSRSRSRSHERESRERSRGRSHSRSSSPPKHKEKKRHESHERSRGRSHSKSSSPPKHKEKKRHESHERSRGRSHSEGSSPPKHKEKKRKSKSELKSTVREVSPKSSDHERSESRGRTRDSREERSRDRRSRDKSKESSRDRGRGRDDKDSDAKDNDRYSEYSRDDDDKDGSPDRRSDRRSRSPAPRVDSPPPSKSRKHTTADDGERRYVSVPAPTSQAQPEKEFTKESSRSAEPPPQASQGAAYANSASFGQDLIAANSSDYDWLGGSGRDKQAERRVSSQPSGRSDEPRSYAELIGLNGSLTREVERQSYGLSMDKLAILRDKKDDIEKAYRNDCETFATVVKMLVVKDPLLEEQLQRSLRENLKDIGQRCIYELREYIDRVRITDQ